MPSEDIKKGAGSRFLCITFKRLQLPITAFCIPESFNINILYQFFDHMVQNGYFVSIPRLKHWF